MNKLLVIDDEVELGRLLGRVAESVGYDVRVTARIADFKDHLAHFMPTVIMLDLSMPEMDGLELLRWLAAQNCRAHIMLMSGFDTRVLDAARRIGEERGLFVAYALTKPIRMPELKEKLASLMENRDDNLDKDDLARGLAEGEMRLFYQPKVDLKTAAPLGTEVLVRWQHPEYELIGPEKFIDLAERSGLISPLTEYVLRAAIAQQKEWREAGICFDMAINLSPANLHDERFADHVTALCAKAAVPPACITFEVTETLAMSRALEALDILTRLRLKGFRLAIDDFGTGFSSLTRLQRLPVTEIKIDRTFVGEAVTMPDAYVIVKTIIDLAHNMKMTSVAEGIESVRHYELLEELGCDLGQGYAIAKPFTAEEFTAWQARWNVKEKTAIPLPAE
jgi:EAL domain-containing protein (putative c-di-GMP-specific phosphodiesterase class I)/CheY-like chemotaxis protein